jgi:hypothetical protein
MDVSGLWSLGGMTPAEAGGGGLVNVGPTASGLAPVGVRNAAVVGPTFTRPPPAASASVQSLER